MNLTKPTNKKQRVKVIFKCTCYARGGLKINSATCQLCVFMHGTNKH